MKYHWMHKKTGHKYRIIVNDAMIQCSTDPQFEEQYINKHWTIYQNIETLKMYIRLTDEFNDGRFQEISTANLT